MQCAVEETRTGSYVGLLRTSFPKQRTDDITTYVCTLLFDVTYVFLCCSAGVLHDSVSETQSQRKTGEEERK